MMLARERFVNASQEHFLPGSAARGKVPNVPDKPLANPGEERAGGL